MKLRGDRECVECGQRWSYFETASVECPTCGSFRSTAVDEEAATHTVGNADLDLAEARRAVESRPIREVATLAATACRTFLANRGFIAAGELQPLDEVTVAASELRHVADEVKRGLDPDEAAERHLLALLQGAPAGDRPAELPSGQHAARGLGVATAVERYRVDLSRYLDEHPDPAVSQALGTLRDHLRRVEALEGDVSPSVADRLLEAARDLGRALRGEEAALARAEDRLSRL